MLCASAPRAPAPRPARSATASAAPSRPSPTPTWCSAGSAPTVSSAARCKLDLDAAKKALTEKIATPLGLDPIEAAEGILRIATTKMAHVVRWVTTERGLDAADFALVAYGGAGPLHASAVARELSIGTVIIPRAPGHFSACGMLVADLRRDFVNTWFTPLADASFPEMERIFAEMERQGRETVGRGQTLSGVEVRRSADMRYVGQEHAVTVELPIDLFTAQDRDGIKKPLRCRASDALRLFGGRRKGRDRQPARRRHRRDAKAAVRAHRQRRAAEPEAAAFRGKRPVYFASTGFVETPTYDRPALKAGNKITGPALIEEHASTTVVHPGDLRGRRLRRSRHHESERS